VLGGVAHGVLLGAFALKFKDDEKDIRGREMEGKDVNRLPGIFFLDIPCLSKECL
jgi:hypothetical protein